MDHKFVFIGGLHRSGTSIVHECLRDHPQISGFSGTGVPEDEGQHLQTVFKPAYAYGGPGRFGHHPESLLDERSPLATPATAERLFGEWSAHWDLTKPILIEKSPPNLVRSRFFQALFPESYFVVTHRHPIAVAYATQKWARTSLVHHLVEHWLACHERFEADRPHLRNVIVFQYEAFVAHPQRIIDEVYRFLGADPIPMTREIHGKINAKYFAKWNARRTGILTRRYTEWVTAKLEDRVQRFGYSLRDVHRTASEVR